MGVRRDVSIALVFLCVIADWLIVWDWWVHGWPWIDSPIDFGPRTVFSLGDWIFAILLVALHMAATFIFVKSRASS